jgi:signal transduction histidine kinase/CheY-like chemotaxis protein
MAVSDATGHDPVQSFSHLLNVEVADFRQRYQHYVFILVAVLTWFAGVRQALMPHSVPTELAPLLCLLVTIALGYLFRQKTALSLAICLVGLATAVTLEVVNHPATPAIYMYAPLVILVSAVASTPVLFLYGVGCGLLLGLLGWGGYSSLAGLVAPGLTLFSATVCGWIASRPIYDSLAMALSNAQDSIRARDELREQRRQLAQSVKALDEALYRLGRSNASLIIARQQAEEARQLKVRFANMISHEIRTPLNIIISFSEVIANAPESYGMREWPASLSEDVNEIYRSGKHLLGLINDVLDLAQVEANRVVLKKERGSVLEVVDQAVGLAGKWFDHAGLYVRREVIGDVPELQFDRIRIRQVILNLLSNARHYTSSGGVTVCVQRTNDEIVVSVKDTGVGISAETLRHLFDEFVMSGQPVDDSTGSGLGLSISRMFIQLHSGRMWAESAGVPGQGTTVYFSLPLPTMNVASELPPSQRDTEFWQSRYDQARSERVILVSADDSTVLRTASRLFNNQGRIVTSSTAGIGQAFLTQQPDAVMAFTGGDGPNYAAALREIELPQDVSLITCELERNTEVENRHPLETQDVNVWLIKPITREDLASAVLSVAPNARSILSVEDDLAMARFYELALASDKRFVTLPTFLNVTHVQDALSCIDEHVPDVILLDLNLVDESGWSLLAKVRARWSREQLPVIAVTAMDRYGLPVLRAREINVKRPQGLSQRETVMCLQNTLDALLS